jgi:hypothetical protein
MGSGLLAPGGPLGGEETGLSHEAQHPVLAGEELVLSAQPGPDLAVALAGEGRLENHLADPLGELAVAYLGCQTRSAPESGTPGAAAIDRGPGRPGQPTDGGEVDSHLRAHFGHFCGGIETPLFSATFFQISFSRVSSPIFRSASRRRRLSSVLAWQPFRASSPASKNSSR